MDIILFTKSVSSTVCRVLVPESEYNKQMELREVTQPLRGELRLKPGFSPALLMVIG